MIYIFVIYYPIEKSTSHKFVILFKFEKGVCYISMLFFSLSKKSHSKLTSLVNKSHRKLKMDKFWILWMFEYYYLC